MNDYSYITVEQRKRTREIDDALALGRWPLAYQLAVAHRCDYDVLLDWLKVRVATAEGVCLFCRTRPAAAGPLCKECWPIYSNRTGTEVSLFGPQGPQGPYHVHDGNCSGEPKGVAGDGLCRLQAAAPNVIEKLRAMRASLEVSTRALDVAQRNMLAAMRAQMEEAQALAEAMLAAEQAAE